MRICISSKSSQSITIGLQVNSDEEKIKLSIIENNKIKQKLVTYLQSLGRKLQDLLHIYRVRREEESSQKATQLLPIIQLETLSLRITKFGEIYKYLLKSKNKLE